MIAATKTSAIVGVGFVWEGKSHRYYICDPNIKVAYEL